MAPEVGQYRNWFTVLTRSLAAPDSFGQQVESWTAGASHAAVIEGPSGTRETLPLDRERQHMQLRFKVYLSTLARTDRLQDAETLTKYQIAGLWREWTGSNWQTVCTVLGVY